MLRVTSSPHQLHLVRTGEAASACFPTCAVASLTALQEGHGCHLQGFTYQPVSMHGAWLALSKPGLDATKHRLGERLPCRALQALTCQEDSGRCDVFRDTCCCRCQHSTGLHAGSYLHNLTIEWLSKHGAAAFA